MEVSVIMCVNAFTHQPELIAVTVPAVAESVALRYLNGLIAEDHPNVRPFKSFAAAESFATDKGINVPFIDTAYVMSHP